MAIKWLGYYYYALLDYRTARVTRIIVNVIYKKTELSKTVVVNDPDVQRLREEYKN